MRHNDVSRMWAAGVLTAPNSTMMPAIALRTDLSLGKQVSQHILRRFVERFEMADVEVLLDHELAEPLEEATGIAGTHHHGVIVPIQADHLVPFQQPRRQSQRLFAANTD